MNFPSMACIVAAFVLLVASRALWNSGTDSKAPAKSAVEEPANRAHRIVRMSNGAYRVETYYRHSFWNPIGCYGNEDMTLETAKAVLKSVEERRGDEPTVSEVIK